MATKTNQPKVSRKEMSFEVVVFIDADAREAALKLPEYAGFFDYLGPERAAEARAYWVSRNSDPTGWYVVGKSSTAALAEKAAKASEARRIKCSAKTNDFTHGGTTAYGWREVGGDVHRV